MPTGVEIKEDARVRVEDGLNADTLVLVILVFLVFVLGAETEGAKATTHSLLEGVVVGLIGAAVVLVRPEQAVQGVRQPIVFGFTRQVIHGDAVVPILIDDADHGEVDLVHLEAGLVLKLFLKRAFPLSPGDGIESAVLEALETLVPDRGLRFVKLPECLRVNVRHALLFRHSCH